MGYTRYYDVKEGIEEFSTTFLAEVLLAIGYAENNYNIKIKGWDGNGEPKINKEIISLNGDNENNLSHETLTIRVGKDQATGFNFCKTNEKPYDAVVSVILDKALEHGYIENLSCDGKSRQDDIANKIKEYIKITNTKNIKEL